MKLRYFTLLLCVYLAGSFSVCMSFGVDQEQGKGDRREGSSKHGDKSYMRDDISGIMGGEGGLQEAILGKIVNNQQAASELGLSEEQIKILKTSMENMKKQHDDFQKQLKDAGLEQAKLMTENTVDENAVFAAVEKAGKVKTEMAKARIKHMLLVKKTLKPEQVDKIKEMVQNRVKQMRSEGEIRGIKGKGEGEGLKDRLRERAKKRQQDDKKEEKKNDSEKPAGSI